MNYKDEIKRYFDNHQNKKKLQTKKRVNIYFNDRTSVIYMTDNEFGEMCKKMIKNNYNFKAGSYGKRTDIRIFPKK